jgi:hypothetical protein
MGADHRAACCVARANAGLLIAAETGSTSQPVQGDSFLGSSIIARASNGCRLALWSLTAT